MRSSDETRALRESGFKVCGGPCLLASPPREDIQVLCGSCHNIKSRGGDPAIMKELFDLGH